MSADKLQQAITLIKSGDKKSGQNLLVDIVNANPKNEIAWLWLASVVSEDKKVFCLEKALSINPNNPQARQYLEKLKPGKPVQPGPVAQPFSTKVVFKPNISKIIVSWLTMSFIVIVLILLSTLNDPTDFVGYLLVIFVALFQTFIFNIIFYNLPYFKIEINQPYLSGPRSLGMGWARAKILIDDINLKNTNSTFGWIGFYLIKSRQGEKISLWGFDEKQFIKLMDLLKGIKRQ
jgi:hypothetical protein